MIKPFTCVCVLLAAGSGLYLYQTKHRTLMLDRQIADVLKQADAARARTAVLKAEYAALSAPSRLGELSDRFLALKPSQPTQYVQLAALDQHLPPIEVFPKPGDLPTPPPAPANATDSDTDGDSGAAALVANAAPGGAPVDGPDAVIAGIGVPTAAKAQGAAAPVPARAVIAATTARAVHHAPLPGSQFASSLHAQPMPMAAPRPVQSSVLATASLRPMGAPARPRITNAGYAAYVPRNPASASSGSLLGSAADVALAPPVPVAN